MNKVNVAQLKARLSAYLAEARAGRSVVVYDRATPIARITPFEDESEDIVVVEATAPPSGLRKIKGVRPRRRVDSDKLLRELRRDR
jgi:prevent-host-death family protein